MTRVTVTVHSVPVAGPLCVGDAVSVGVGVGVAGVGVGVAVEVGVGVAVAVAVDVAVPVDDAVVVDSLVVAPLVGVAVAELPILDVVEVVDSPVCPVQPARRTVTTRKQISIRFRLLTTYTVHCGYKNCPVTVLNLDVSVQAAPQVPQAPPRRTREYRSDWRWSARYRCR